MGKSAMRALVLVVLFGAQSGWAFDPYQVKSRKDDLAFEVVRGKRVCDGSARAVSIRLGSAEIPLGHVSEGCSTCGGMDPELIAVHRLPGGGAGPDLLHIEWAGGASGARGQEDTAYRIVLQSDPRQVLVSGRIRPFERLGGQGPMWMDSYLVSYREGILRIEETLRLFDFDLAKEGDDAAEQISETLVSVSYKVGTTPLKPVGGEVRYRIISPQLARRYEADELNRTYVFATKAELMREFKLKPEWEVTAASRPDELRFDLPTDVASRLTGPRRRPVGSECPALDLGPGKP